ncbi:sensor histidine kinase [Erythrobacter neustonensis]|nr:ATP-binding protein [Erythrobacter neustonensis]
MTATDYDEDVPMQASENRQMFGYLTSRPWIPLVLGFALVLGVGVITTLTVAASQTYNREVRRALVTLGAADSVTLSILEMNSAQRGYILNRDEAFRKRFIQARSDLDRDLRALKSEYAVLDLPEGLEEEVEIAVNDRLSAFNEINRMLTADDVAGAGRYSAEARLFTDNVRDALRKVKQVAYNRLYASQRAATAAGDRAYLLIIAGLVMACLLILGSIVLLVRRSGELEKANEEVRQLAETLEHRVEERTADLAEANEEIQRFAYIVSHDLRSPLVNIMGFTAELEDAQRTMADYATAEDSAVPPDVREAIVTDMPEAMGFIRAATGRMDRLIKAILQISREGRRTLTRDTIDLRALFEGIADSLSGQTDAAGATITVGDLPEVEGDRTALEQVFGNLLDNAVKYLRPGVPGEIKVTGEQRGKRVVIRVEDNGRGIAAHDRRRVFELFRRSGEQDRPGEGIGLAHVQALVRRLGGQIHVESELGEGSCFTVTLPLTMATRN